MARRMQRERRLRRGGRRIAGVAGLLVASVALAAPSAFGTFTGGTTVPHNANSGTLGLTLTSPDAQQAFEAWSLDLYPGASRERLGDLTISGTVALKTLTVTIALCITIPCVGSELNTDTTNGIQVTIERCSQAWTHVGVAPSKTYTCGGTTSLVQPEFPIINTKSLTADPGDSLLTVGSVNRYRFTFRLPTTSPDSMEGKVSGFKFTFNGTQRDATSK